MKNHGGKRPGAGRKKKEPTTTIRVPISLVDKIKTLIYERNNPIPDDSIQSHKK